MPISDSLRGTTSCIAERSLNTANAEFEELEEPEEGEPDELDEPAPVRPLLDEEAPAAAAALDPDPLEELLVLEALVVPLPDTISPT